MLRPDAFPALTGAPALPATRAVVQGLGSALPERAVGNDEVGALLGVDDAWIRRRTGIASRRRAGEGDSTTTLATTAALAALDDSGLTPDDVDLVLVATMTPDFATPQVAPLVAAAIGAGGAGAFDVAAACTAWLSALGAAASFLETGRATCAVVVGVEVMSRVIDPLDRSTAILFADGAGAAVVTAGGEGGVVGPLVLGSDGSSAEHITCPVGGVVAMDGHATFQRAVTAMCESALAVCDRAGITLDDVDLVVPHQANSRIIAAVGERLGLDPSRVLDVIEHSGNTSSATIPIALAGARADGRLPDAGNVLLAAFGAGLTWGAALLTFGTDA